jgi:hypothetical protein
MATKRMTKEAVRRQAARQRVNNLVRSGAIPHPHDSFCMDCRGPASHYDHHRGYDDEHALDVVSVCVKCHAARSVGRGEGRGVSPWEERLPGRMRGFGGAVWRERLRQGLTRAELAARAGYKTAGSIYDIEEFGTGRKKAAAVERIARALGIAASALLRSEVA